MKIKFLFTQEMFQRNHLDDLPYSIRPNDVAIFEDQILTNINVFSFFNDERKEKHPIFICKQKQPRTTNLIYWNEHYARIYNISRLFCKITKHHGQLNYCLRCHGHFKFFEILMSHKEFCTREDYMSVVHILPSAESLDSHIKF
jgi:hypothetical protein